MAMTKTKRRHTIALLLVAGFLTAIAPFAAERFIETEAILPFTLEHRTIANPALNAWDMAPSNPCGVLFCLQPDLNVYSYAPADAKAVAYVFHGGSGSAEMWITGEEEAALLGDLARHEYAIVLLESTHRPIDANWFFPDPERFSPQNFSHPATPGSSDAWNATVNADEQVVRNVHALLGYNTDTPVFLVGFSSGAKFASAMAYSLELDPPALGDYYYTNPRTNTGGGLNVRAAALYNNVGVPYYFGNYQPSPGDPVPAPLATQYDTPTIFNYSLNDGGNPVTDIEANADFLATLGVPVEKNLSQPTRLRPDRFARVLGLSYAESRDLYAALAPYIDPNGFVLPSADTAPVMEMLSIGKRTGVTDQLKVLRAEHHVSSEYHHRTVAFFDAHL